MLALVQVPGDDTGDGGKSKGTAGFQSRQTVQNLVVLIDDDRDAETQVLDRGGDRLDLKWIYGTEFPLRDGQVADRTHHNLKLRCDVIPGQAIHRFSLGLPFKGFDNDHAVFQKRRDDQSGLTRDRIDNGQIQFFLYGPAAQAGIEPFDQFYIRAIEALRPVHNRNRHRAGEQACFIKGRHHSDPKRSGFRMSQHTASGRSEIDFTSPTTLAVLFRRSKELMLNATVEILGLGIATIM
ncbi:MAG TPA: hypothetical protein PL193_04770 [Xanthobacteraceae bacterium]|nr:hypothetical protein [Xanthobacteraceae bacterium]